MQLLKQSTTTTILVGPVLDSAGAAVTTAVLANFSITKNGTVAVLTGATVAHDHNGHYTIALTTGNTDTLGRLTITINNSAMAMAPFRYSVLTASAFDTLVTNGTIAKAGDQMDLINSPNATARQAFATTIEAAILNEGDATALLAAIAAKVEQFLINDGDATATLAAIATAVNAAVVAGQIGTDLTTTKASAATAATQATAAASSAATAATQATTAATNTTTLLGRITAPVYQMFLDFIQMLTGSTTANVKWTTKALENAPASSGSGSGTGARTVTITVNDGTTALQNAIVRMHEGASSYTATTNASGVATFNLDDATYTVAITKQGYSYAGTTLVVDGDESQTYSMTQISITPGSGSATTGYVTCLDNTGTAEADVTVYAQMIDPPTSGTGYAYDASVRTVTSDEDGVAELTGMIKGATYQLWRGKRATGRTVTIPSDAGSTYALPSLVGE